MKIVRLVRLEKSEQGLVGALIVDDRFICVTLERDDTFLKPGCYECDRYSSEKYPDTFEIMVPGHTKVLFHSGNDEDDTLGCVLVAQYTGYLEGKRAVLNTKRGAGHASFMSCFSPEDLVFKLFVEDRYL